MSSSAENSASPQRVSEPASPILGGVLHTFVAFDWGEEIDLERARSLVPAETRVLPRRRRTPASIAYRPPPLRLHLAPVTVELPGIGCVPMSAEATVFDFAAVSIAMHAPFELSGGALTELAGALAEPAPLVKLGLASLEPLYAKLLPAVQNPRWQHDLSEEYFVFHVPPTAALPEPGELMEYHAGWLASLVRLEPAPLSSEEIAEALRVSICYSPDDLLVLDWAAAFLLDADCDETLQTIEFGNLQLLEFRHIDERLDARLATTYGMIHSLAQSRLPFWHNPRRSLRALGELKVEATGLFERTENVLKLVGDQYLARVYRMLASRFHLEEWEKSIQRKLDVAEGVYRVVSDQTDTYRAEFLEIVVVLLILLEILLAIFRH
ncbi:MAG TPA: hypothetical protein VGY58_07480 [Gemmataceae bacterium]|jgi:hypothetical protein|nr:hypothetical protein [Gemmataceae bacterium]